MKKTATLLLACMALGLASQAAAQSISPAWDAYRKQQKAGQSPTTSPGASAPAISDSQPAPLAAAEVAPAPSAAPAATPAPMPAQVRPPKEKARIKSGAFIGVQGGKGWVYDDIDQNMIGLSAGYRWRAGSVTLIGVELAAGQLDRVSDHDGFYAPAAQFGSLGGTARFNFGNSPMFALARLGYWSGRSKDNTDDERVYGAYAGAGLGVDLGRHANLSVVYTNYIYANDYDYGDEDISINRADMVNLGVEVRF